MVITTDPQVAAPTSGNRRRLWRRLVIALVAVVVLAGVGVGVGFWIFALRYSPLQVGFAFGPYRDPSRFVQRDTDLGPEVYIRGSAGTQGRWLFLIQNTGSFSVRIDRVQTGGPFVAAQWSPYRFRDGGNAFGVPLPFRSFPASVAPHSLIRVLLTIRQPRCPRIGVIEENTSTIAVDWHALGVHHQTWLPFAADDTYVGCPMHPIH